MRHFLARAAAKAAEWIRTRLGLVDLVDDELPPPLPVPVPPAPEPAAAPATKLPIATFGRLTTSNIWSEPEPVRVVWLTLLVIADPNGSGQQTLRDIAVLADVDYGETCRAVERLVELGRLERQLLGDGWRIKEFPRYQEVRPSPAAS